MNIVVKDSRKKDRTIVVEHGFTKPSGIKCARICNDRGQVYFTQVKPDGSGSCTCESRKPCYHMTALLSIDLPTYDETLSQRIGTISVQNAIKDAIDALETNEYNSLASTKRVSHGYGCCGHIVKLEHDGQLCGACLCK